MSPSPASTTPPFPTHYSAGIGSARGQRPDAMRRRALSHWPVLTELGIAVMAVGALTSVAIVLVGAALTVVGSFRFALEHHRNRDHENQLGNLGVDHRKAALWVFLGSECVFFGTLIATYLAYKGRSVVGSVP